MKIKAKKDKVNKKFFVELRRAIFRNAKRLMGDAEELFYKGSYPSSVFLSICALEEFGKLHNTLCDYLDYKHGKLDLKSFNRDFRNHYKKQLNSFVKAVEGKTKVTKLVSKLWEFVADNKLMTIRNKSIYTEMEFESKQIFSPSESITSDDAIFFIKLVYEIAISSVSSAYADWIDYSEDIDVLSLRMEERDLKIRFEMFKKKINLI